MREFAIILAADLAAPDRVLEICSRTADVVDGIKIGMVTVLQAGLPILQDVKKLIPSKPLLLDLKIADIGMKSDSGWQGTNWKIIQGLQGTGVTHVTVHGFPGPGSIAEAVAAGQEFGIGILLLPLMSHAGAGLFFNARINSEQFAREMSEAKVQVASQSQACDVTETILTCGEELGVAGYIGPATRPDDLKKYRQYTKKPIWCPGFGRQDRLGRNLEQQFREWVQIVGPQSAAIVGSTIFASSDPSAAAQEVRTIRDRVVI